MPSTRYIFPFRQPTGNTPANLSSLPAMEPNMHGFLDHNIPFGNAHPTVLQPRMAYTHNASSGHIDHRVPFGAINAVKTNETVLQLSSAAKSTIDASVKASTLIRKHNCVQKFLDWAATENLTPDDVLPANETTLCNYAATFAGHTAGGTARAHISALKGWTLHKGHFWQGGDRLNSVLNGVERRAPPGSYRPPRAPVKESYLTILLDEMRLDGSDGKEAAIAAAAHLMFFGQLRAGEVLPDSPLTSRYDLQKHPKVSDLGPANEQGTRSLFLPSTKTSRNRGETASIATQASRNCPIRAVNMHIQINRLSAEDPLFAYRDNTGKLHCLTRKECVDRCNELWVPKSIPKISGHCFRIGGTTHFLCHGVPPDVVKALGRWKSDAFLAYWRDLDTLASVHLHRYHVQESYHSRLYTDRM